MREISIESCFAILLGAKISDTAINNGMTFQQCRAAFHATCRSIDSDLYERLLGANGATEVKLDTLRKYFRERVAAELDKIESKSEAASVSLKEIDEERQQLKKQMACVNIRKALATYRATCHSLGIHA